MQEIAEVYFLELEEKREIAEFAKQVMSACFVEEQIESLNFYISITLTTPEQIHKLNKEYRNVDKETDVLSFPMFEKDELEEKIQKNDFKHEDVLGDIIISIDRVEEQAKEYEHSFEREFSYMLVHGFYHLMGYDHIQEEDKIMMRPKEEKILTDLKINRE